MGPRSAFGLVISAVLTSFLATPAWSASGVQEAPFRFYTVVDGLTQSEIIDIEQDRAGYLWIATARGLNRYDGKEFQQFTIADGLPHNSLTALYVSEMNSIWIGDARGNIVEMLGARVIRTIEPAAGMIKPVIDIEFVGERKLAVIEGAGIFEFDTDSDAPGIRHLVGNATSGITDLHVDGDDVWVESGTGLYRFSDDGSPELMLLSNRIRHVDVDSLGTQWAADRSGVLGIRKNGAFTPLAEITSDEDIVSIVTDSDGRVWIATRDELFEFNSRGSAAQTAGGNLQKFSGIDDVTSAFVDRENSVWLTSGSRLIRHLGDRFRHFRLRTGSESETVWAISEDQYGRFWFATESKLLMRQRDESLIVVGQDFGIPKGTIRDIVADGNGTMWVGITDFGLFRLDVDAMQARHVGESGNAKILDIAVAADGAVWYSTVRSGVFRYDPASRSMTRFETPGDTSVYSLDIAPDGAVWYGADDVGVVRLVRNERGGYDEEIIGAEADDGKYSYARLIPRRGGGHALEQLDSSRGLPKRLFNQISVTGTESAWIVTEEGGLYRFADDVFIDFGGVTPLADQTVYLVEPLANGSIVVGGEDGLYQFVPGSEEIAHYNQQAGFVGLETNVHATFVDSGGFLWIGTIDGASRMDITQPVPQVFSPTPTITRVETYLGGRPIFDKQEIEPEQLGARIEYAAISLSRPRGTQYSYKLEGIDADWGPATTSRTVSYPRIPPGFYEFTVRARHPGGKWSAAVASHSFTVLPYFWQQQWFLVAVAVSILAGIYLLVAYRTRNIRWHNERLREQVEERTSSIEKARQSLLISNERLSAEMDARAELETRFRRAFEHAPIGMGLLDTNGELFDANPALKAMFWPDSDSIPTKKLLAIIGNEHRQSFEEQYADLIASQADYLDMRLDCIGADGKALNTAVNLSAVRSDTGKFLYSVIQVQDITESLKLNVQLEYQASYDELTGLLNRRAFEARLKDAWESGVESGKHSFLMFMDLDQFKVVNDTSGHTAGDQLLRAVAEILGENVRNNDVVGRLGGDEFGIILWECPTEPASRIAETIRNSIDNFRFHWDEETYRIGVSIGGLAIDSRLGDINELQQLADSACFAAKEAGRNQVQLVSDNKSSASAHRGQVRWVQRLREAMDKNRFVLYTQPIQPIKTDSFEPKRLEVLLRLREAKTHKLIPPGAFLPAAERFGLSMDLDKWVVKSLLDMLLADQAFEAVQRKYWINLSASSVGDRGFAKFLVSTLRDLPLAPGTINFEIAETAVKRSIAEASSLMESLRELGCQFALDDFGSGLSSYGYLRKLPVDYVKIDGSFIRNLMNDESDRIFVKSIIEIAHTLNIKVIAEFVESEEVLAAIGALGADYAQGFAIGVPQVFVPRFSQSVGPDDDNSDIHLQAG